MRAAFLQAKRLLPCFVEELGFFLAADELCWSIFTNASDIETAFGSRTGTEVYNVAITKALGQRAIFAPYRDNAFAEAASEFDFPAYPSGGI